MGFAAEAPKDSVVYDLPDLTPSVELGQGFHASILARIGWRRRKKWTSVRLLALRLMRVVSAIVRSVATWFEVGNRIFSLVVGAQLVRVGTIVVPIGLSLVAHVLVVVVVGQLLFLGRTVVLGSSWRGEVVLNVVCWIQVGSRPGIVGFPGKFPIDVHIWYEVIVTNPFEVLCLLRLRSSGLATVAVRVHVVSAFVTVVSLFATGVTEVGRPAEARRLRVHLTF